MWTWAIGIALATITLAVSGAAFWQAARTGRAQSIAEQAKIDAQAYERARQLYESAISTSEGVAGRLREEVHALHEEISRLRSEVVRLRASNAELQQQVERLNATQ